MRQRVWVCVSDCVSRAPYVPAASRKGKSRCKANWVACQEPKDVSVQRKGPMPSRTKDIGVAAAGKDTRGRSVLGRPGMNEE